MIDKQPYQVQDAHQTHEFVEYPANVYPHIRCEKCNIGPDHHWEDRLTECWDTHGKWLALVERRKTCNHNFQKNGMPDSTRRYPAIRSDGVNIDALPLFAGWLQCDKCEEYLTPEKMLSDLLKEEIVFLNDLSTDDKNYTTCCYVLCNDVFMWGCADAEDLPLKNIPDLWLMQKKYGEWSGTIFAILKRKEPPQGPVERSLKEKGFWNDELENIKRNFLIDNPNRTDCGQDDCSCSKMKDVPM